VRQRVRDENQRKRSEFRNQTRTRRAQPRRVDLQRCRTTDYNEHDIQFQIAGSNRSKILCYLIINFNLL